MQIINGFWLAKNTEETNDNQSDWDVLTTKFKKMAMVFSKQQFDFVRKKTIKKLKKKHIPKTQTQ